MAKKIAILLSTYNGERFLEEQIESIIKQSNQQWTLYIRDDGSTDKTLDILGRYQADDRIQWINENKPQNLRVIGSFLKLLESAEADYYMFCDQDDVWLSDKVQVTLNKMLTLEAENKQQPILVHTDLRIVDQDLKATSESMIKTQNLDPQPSFGRLLVQNSITGCTMMINQNLKDRCVGLDFTKIRMHDWWFALVASAFGTIGYVPQATILYRQHGDNEVGAKNSLSELMSRKHLFAQTKQMIQLAMAQATEFVADYPNLTDDKVEMVHFYTNVKNYSKVERYRKMRTYGLLKNGSGRNAFYVFQMLTW
ncbi:glycosyltransferase family 2 protein [Latilactobacillus curvatus]|uniref:glycosyltransferase family 2 protein n=1 Tax=Latilactobacillus curvatus TaxID=28038 RepID=UPI001300DEA9|nr:glycosyltransferase family 2 protein [Latilactobacillus curvatus]MCW8780526.1 glycosyltransferase family 2 protein [Latilactobacillus curvatus]